MRIVPRRLIDHDMRFKFLKIKFLGNLKGNTGGNQKFPRALHLVLFPLLPVIQKETDIKAPVILQNLPDALEGGPAGGDLEQVDQSDLLTAMIGNAVCFSQQFRQIPVGTGIVGKLFLNAFETFPRPVFHRFVHVFVRRSQQHHHQILQRQCHHMGAFFYDFFDPRAGGGVIYKKAVPPLTAARRDVFLSRHTETPY